ncbi:CCA tRNA nucleotidyltransferase [Veillonella sp. 3310]|uniref:CCA tRNA nucleotidyltransferase n=1 Tax=Veillonella sp. 3310 TaxID=2490956 RepID=UPI000FD673EE|nr:HD domain-containing protein [Veillonella sp. 3310]
MGCLAYRETSAYQGALRILQTLQKAQEEAYIVGGAVRDIQMGRMPHDYDIVTSAMPEVVIDVLRTAGFTTTNVVGASFGVVVVSYEEHSYEVATYRSEQYGDDSHRPVAVQYPSTFLEDVRRRDFTINGLALTESGQIRDEVGGLQDIEHRRLCTIGSSKERFQEDALRMFRLCRFAGQLGFSIDSSTWAGIEPNLYRVEGLSLERVRIEIEKMLLSDHVDLALDALVRSHLNEQCCQQTIEGKPRRIPILPELTHLVDLPQAPEHHVHDGWRHTLAVVKGVPQNLVLRWAALLHDVGKGVEGVRGFHNGRITDRNHDRVGAQMTRDILTRLGYAKEFVNLVVWLVERHMRFHFYVANGSADLRKWMQKEARDGVFRETKDLVMAMECLKELGVADVIGSGTKDPEPSDAYGSRMVSLAQTMPVHTKDLHYDKGLPALVGPYVKEVMQTLLQRVQSGDILNTPEALQEAGLAKYRRLKEKE